MSRMLELPDSVYQALMDAARSRGITPEAWIAERLLPSESRAGRPAPMPPTRDREESRARLYQQTVSLGHPTGLDNESIDADLARAYANGHPAPSDEGRV